MVSDNNALVLAQSAAEDEGPSSQSSEPFITFMLNGVPMRFRAGGLAPAMERGILSVQQSMVEGGTNAKTKALALMLRQAAGLIIPLMRPLVATIRQHPTVPDAIKRSLPEVPVVPKHADRVAFLMAYLSGVVHAALTNNAYVLDVVEDEAAAYPDIMKVAVFGAVEPESVPHEALPDGEIEDEGADAARVAALPESPSRDSEA